MEKSVFYLWTYPIKRLETSLFSDRVAPVLGGSFDVCVMSSIMFVLGGEVVSSVDIPLQNKQKD